MAKGAERVKEKPAYTVHVCLFLFIYLQVTRMQITFGLAYSVYRSNQHFQQKTLSCELFVKRLVNATSKWLVFCLLRFQKFRHFNLTEYSTAFQTTDRFKACEHLLCKCLSDSVKVRVNAPHHFSISLEVTHVLHRWNKCRKALLNSALLPA